MPNPQSLAPLPPLLQVGLLAFVASVLLTAGARRTAARLGWLDHPNVRSSHERPTARTGGLAVLAATVGGIIWGHVPGLDAPAARAFLAGLLAIAALGFWDDRCSLSPFTRLGFQTAIGAGFVAFSGGVDRLPLPPPLDVPLGWLGAPIAMLWIVAVVNFYNFLDGIDGLAGLQAVVTGLGLALLGIDPLVSLVAVSLAGASLGFLVHNWSPARIFLGDAGSGLMGFVFASLPLLAPPESRSGTVLFAATSLWFFLADAVWTLARRIARGERWYEAHREHLYQRLVASGLGHAPVAAALGGAAAVVTAVALSALDGRGAVALLLAVLLFCGELILVAWRTRLQPVETGPRA